MSVGDVTSANSPSSPITTTTLDFNVYSYNPSSPATPTTSSPATPTASSPASSQVGNNFTPPSPTRSSGTSTALDPFHFDSPVFNMDFGIAPLLLPNSSLIHPSPSYDINPLHATTPDIFSTLQSMPTQHDYSPTTNHVYTADPPDPRSDFHDDGVGTGMEGECFVICC